MNETLGFGHFLAHADGIAMSILIVMLFASIGTWYLIATQSLRRMRERERGNAFRASLERADSIEAVVHEMDATRGDEPFSRVLHEGLAALGVLHGGQRNARGLIEGTAGDEFLARALKHAIDRERARLNYGQAFLATVASTAPFVGLFGTVWGIYHALIAIGLSGQGTLDKVAGPVGEALIMTAIGLAVAIPASAAYNNFARVNRNLLGELADFAHDMFCLLSTGSRRAEPAATREHLLSLVGGQSR